MKRFPNILFFLILPFVLMGCPGGDDGPRICTKEDVPGGCDGGTIVVGEYPDCECIVPGTDEPSDPSDPGGGGDVVR